MTRKILLLVVFLFSSLGLMACSNNNSTPEKFTSHFYETITTATDDAQVAELLYLPSTEKISSQEKEKIKLLVNMMKDSFADKGKFSKVDIISVTYNDDKTEAKVAAKVEFVGGDTLDDTLQLIKTEQGWKVNMKSQFH